MCVYVCAYVCVRVCIFHTPMEIFMKETKTNKQTKTTFFGLYLNSYGYAATHKTLREFVIISAQARCPGHRHRLFRLFSGQGARCSSVVRAFAHGAMGRRVDPSWGGLIELFLVPASAPRLV